MEFTLRPYPGATADFEFPHLMAEAVLPRPRADWRELLAASIQTAMHLARAVKGGQILGQAATLVPNTGAALDPWSVWIRAFENAHGVPAWPLKSETDERGWVRLRSACPYQEALSRWVAMGHALLWIGHRALSGGPLQFNAAALDKAVREIGGHLPDRKLMETHFAIGAQQLPWRWRGGEVTLVGQGSRQRWLSGAPSDPEQKARELAQLDLLVPIYTVTGSIGKTTTVRLLTQLLATSGLRLAVTASDGAWIGNKRLSTKDCIGARAAQALLGSPEIDAAVLEFGRGGLIKRGMPFNHVDVAVLLNVDAMHLGLDGIDTLEAMADVKALTLRHAKVAVINRDDVQCRRVADRLDPKACIWFSLRAAPKELAKLSTISGGALGVSRDLAGSPLALEIWRDGAREKDLPLEGVTPYHGMLGEKTVEELLAAVGACWFGPVEIPDWDTALGGLHLDSSNHPFRTSVHRRDNMVFVLDKAGEEAALAVLKPAIAQISAKEKVGHRIAMIARSAGIPPERHRQSCALLYPLVDEFICFDIKETYSSPTALSTYAPGSIPALLADELERLNKLAKLKKPVQVAADWEEATHLLSKRVATDGKFLVLINQPGTSFSELNERIVAFVDGNNPALNRKTSRK